MPIESTLTSLIKFVDNCGLKSVLITGGTGRDHYLVGKITVGIGHMNPDKSPVSSIRIDKAVNKSPGSIATFQEKQEELDNTSRKKRNYKTEWYVKHTSVIMTQFRMLR